MKEKVIKSVSKRIAAFGICLVSAASMIASAIPTAEAKASKDILGTNTALGSPVLNHTNFTSEDWNEWETICWGVFLGNFCQPLIDNYESTFKEGHGGSNGHGFHALWGGSGSDLANKDVIKALTEYAIDKQAEIAEPIYVSYTKGNNIGLPLKKDEADIKTADVRTARFRDLFFYWEEQFSDGGGTATVEEPTDGASAGPVAATVGETDDSSSETTEAATDEDGNPVEQDPTEATIEADESATNVGYSMPNGQNSWSYENGNLTARSTTPGPSNRNSFQSATIYQGDRDEFIGDTLPADDPETLTDPPAPGDENSEGATEDTTSNGPSTAQNEAANKGITFAKFVNGTPQLNGAGDITSGDFYNVISRDKFGNEYDDMLTASDYNLPTFYVRRIFGENSYDQLYKSHNEYITILDYTDWWDVQIMSMLLNAIRDDEELGSSVLDDSTIGTTEPDAEQQQEEDGNPVNEIADSLVTSGDKNNLNISSKTLKKAFQKLWSENPGIQLDTFGNIVVKSGDTEGVMVMPAALNQNVTGERKINTLNSWILNNMRGGVTDQTLRLSACQMGNSTGNALEDKIKDAGTSWFGINNQYKLNGMPALASSGVGYTGIFYYDLDSFMVKYARELEAGKRKPEDMLYGNALLELFDTKLDSDFTSPNAPLKFELMNISDKFSKTEFAVSKDGEANVSDVLQSQMLAASCLPNILFDYDAGESGQKRLLHNLLTPSGEAKIVYTNKPSVLAVRLDPIKVNARDIDSSQQGIAAVRLFYSWLYDKYNIKSETATYNRNSVLATLKDKNFDSFYKSVGSGKSEFSIFNGFLKDINKYGDADVGHEDYSDSANWNPNQNHAFSKENSRVVLAYKGSKEQEFLASCTAIKEGAEFDLYCTYLYMTYLDFYGVNSSATVKTGVHNSSDFDSLIYATDLRKGNLIEDIAKELYDYDTNLADKIDVEDEVLQMSYMMLNPDNAAARDYRRKLANNTITDFLYEQYNRMVYGRSTNYSGTASSSRSGFLSIETYADNVFTKPFLDNYVVVAVWLIMGSVLFILIVGLIKKKKVSWFFITTVVAINSFVIAPTSGEIVPYVTSAATTRLFYDKMTFWSISQGITNAEIERSARVNEKSFRDIEDSDATVLLNLANSLLSLHTDSSLCVKQDISQKVTQTAEGVYKDIESYASAQWIIPMVMQQFSSNTSENLENFIYKPLANIWTDLSNIYWYFEPSDAELTDSMSKTYTSGQITGKYAERTGADGSGEFAIFKRINKYYPDFVDPDNQPNVYTGPDGKFWNCRSYSTYIRNPKESAHVVLPYLDSNLQLSIPSRATTISNYKDADSWGDYIRNAKNSNSGVTYYNWLVCDPDAQGRSTTARMADTADSYDRYDRDTITPDMPYLLSTESPIYYMYAIVKDSFQSDASYGRLVRDIQGTVKEAEQGNETKPVFFSFMYATKSSTENGEAAQSTATSEINSDSPLEATGYVRDVLDLQEMFTNIIPYMYQMSISACGFTGTDGILGDARITKDLNYYEGELQSWMYRCNWATKIMENPAYSEPVTVRDANGQVYDVVNPLLPECYPQNRPMVFSEAQREAMGLKDKDLSQVELKCIKLNKDTVREWQLLLNYVVTDGMTKEIMMRQMATDATLLFCNTFGNIGVLDNKYTMYPTSLDLRYLSFDAIMRILMLNVSSNTNYASGDAMLNVLSNSDMVTGVLLLLAAFFGAFLMPFFRTLLMAVIFYLGFWAIINTIVATRERKVNVVCGQVVSNILFMVYTLAYYGVYYLLMKVTNPAEGLHVHSVSTNTGSPAWMIFIVLVINIVYVAILGKHIIFCVKNRNDMGYAAYRSMAGSIVDSISELGGKAGTAISNVFNGFGDFSHNEHNQHVGNTQSISGSGLGFGAFGDTGGSQGRSGDTTTNIGGDSIEVNTVNNKNTSSKVDLGLVESDYNIQDSGPSSRGDRDSKTEIYTTPDDINNTIASGGKEIKKDDTFVDVDFNNSVH